MPPADYGTTQHLVRTAGRDMSLGETAWLAGYSKFHFHRLFRQKTGQTYLGFVNDCRLQQARAMLREGCAKTAIAAALGFSHPSAFLRWLKRIG